MTAYNRSWLIPLRFVAFLWLIKAVELLLGISFANFGVYPRHAFGLVGVLLAPLIHGDVYHLLSNYFLLLPAFDTSDNRHGWVRFTRWEKTFAGWKTARGKDRQTK